MKNIDNTNLYNQVIDYIEEKYYFLNDKENELTIYENWNYSKTTKKHFKMFIEQHLFFKGFEEYERKMYKYKNFTRVIEKMIKEGIVIRGY